MPVRDARTTTSALPSFAAIAPSATSTDRLVLIHVCDNPAGMAAPSGGWSLAGSVASSGTLGTNVWVRTAGLSAPSSYTITQGADADSVVIIAAVSGVSGATPRVGIAQASGDEVVTPNVDLPAGTGTELRIGAGWIPPVIFADWAEPSGYEIEAQGQSRFFVSAMLSSRTVAVPGATGEVPLQVDHALQYLHGLTVLFSDQVSSGGETPPAPPPTVPALPSDARVVHYTYEFVDLLTDAQICKDLDLRDVSYERRIGEAGSFSASLDITDEVSAGKVARILPRHPEDLSTGPGRTLVHVYRNGVVWGSFVIWAASVSWQGRGPITVSINGTSLESYLSHVKIREDVPYEGWDQIDIARDLITRMQSTPRYDIGLQFQAGTSGVTRDRVYLASEGSTYGERIAELAAVQNGFEWAIQVVDNGDGTRSRVVAWGAPKLGSPATGHKFMQPGAVLSWQEDIDSLRGGTAFQTRGESINEDASTTSEPLVSQVVLAQAHIDAGWPGLDVTADYSSVSEVDTLDSYAQWWATNRGGAVRVHQATVRLPANTSYGPGNLGDTVTFMLSNPWWPIENGQASFAKAWRVVGMAFKPPAKGSGQEECTLTFEELAEEG